MNVSFQRNVDRFAGSIICRILSLLPGAGSEPPASMKPRRILVILLSEMSSLVLAQPMFHRLLDNYPESSLHVLCFRQNKEVLDVLGVIPEEQILTVRNDSLGHMWSDSVDVLKKMRRIGVDTVIDCELFSRIGSIYAFFSGAKIHVGDFILIHRKGSSEATSSIDRCSTTPTNTSPNNSSRWSRPSNRKTYRPSSVRWAGRS